MWLTGWEVCLENEDPCTYKHWVLDHGWGEGEGIRRAFLIIAIVACLGTGISSKQHIIQNRRRSQVHGMNDVLIWVIDGGPSLRWGVREYVCSRSVVLAGWMGQSRDCRGSWGADGGFKINEWIETRVDAMCMPISCYLLGNLSCFFGFFSILVTGSQHYLHLLTFLRSWRMTFEMIYETGN